MKSSQDIEIRRPYESGWERSYVFTVENAQNLKEAINELQKLPLDKSFFSGGYVGNSGIRVRAYWSLWRAPLSGKHMLNRLLQYTRSLRPIRYLLTLRIAAIRRPLRTGKLRGFTIMSYVDEPEMTRLP